MTKADWILFVEVLVGASVYFYLRVWLHETAKAGSWGKAHSNLWRKPKRWQLVTFCLLWGFIIVMFVILVTNK